MATQIDGSLGINKVNPTALPGIMPAGSVLQVVSATYSTIENTSSVTFSNTGITATITPNSITSKILVLVSINGCGKYTTNTAGALRIIRNSVPIINIDSMIGYTNNTNTVDGSSSATILDSPSTTSSITYTVQKASGSNSNYFYINDYYNTIGPTTSTITLMEIAG